MQIDRAEILRLLLWRVNSGGTQARHPIIQQKVSKIQWRALMKAMVVSVVSSEDETVAFVNLEAVCLHGNGAARA